MGGGVLGLGGWWGRWLLGLEKFCLGGWRGWVGVVGLVGLLGVGVCWGVGGTWDRGGVGVVGDCWWGVGGLGLGVDWGGGRGGGFIC